MRILVVAHEVEQNIHGLRLDLYGLAHRIAIIPHDEKRLFRTN